MRRLLVIPIFLLLLLAGAMILSRPAVEQKADFTYVDRADVSTLDFPKLTYMQDIRVAYALWEGLYTLDTVTLDPVPGCAFPIEVSEDKKVYTFHIRPEAKWSNGDPVLARDFVFAWKRMLDEQSQYAELFNYIVGAEEYGAAVAEYEAAKVKGEKPSFANVGIETLDQDPRWLRVKLKNSTAFFPDLIAFSPFFPAHEKSMMMTDRTTGKLKVNPSYTRPPNLVSNGPYRLDKWDFKRRLRMVASDYYWDKPSVKSRVIDFLVIESPQNAFEAFNSGAIDWWVEVPGDIGGELLRKKHTDLHNFTSFGTYFYSFNCQDKLPDGTDNPLKKIAVRQALSMGVEKQFLVDKIMRMGQPIATDYVPPGAFNGYVSPKGLPYDPERARKLLSDAGYPNGDGLPVFKLNFNNEGQHKEIAEYLQRQWKQNLNVTTELDGKELASYREQLSNKKYSISRASWYGDYNDPSTFTDKYLPNSGNNDADWRNEKFAALCADAARETDPTKRLRIFEKAETILLEEAPIMPLYHYVNSGMFRSNVKGLPMNPRNMNMLKSAEVIRK